MSSERSCVIAIDQGTTSSRAIGFDAMGNIVATAQREFTQFFPEDGWVEHDLEEIWSTTVLVLREILSKLQELGHKVVSIGITNQRETTAVWDAKSGEPIYRAIVWQDRRTADICNTLRDDGVLDTVQSRTGLLLDPYFSATKVAWILDNVSGARNKADAGELRFGTIDTFLIWRLTGGERHVTDATNASRTNLFNINTMQWDSELLRIFDVPESVLPQVLNCADDFGVTVESAVGDSIPIYGVAGDQQAAAIGQCCFEPGSIKSTYGTGCFVLINSGDKPVFSQNQLLTTVAYQLDGQPTYALEGSIFIAGAVVQWLRDEIGVISSAADTEDLAASLQSNDGVYMVPAFTGLGAPYWDPTARGAITGLTRGSGVAHLVRAGLESVCYQTHDLLSAMAADGIEATSLRVDGGMAANDWLVQFMADILDIQLQRPAVLETTALGAAYLAGRRSGLYGDLTEFADRDTKASQFTPSMDPRERTSLLKGWRHAVDGVLK